MNIARERERVSLLNDLEEAMRRRRHDPKGEVMGKYDAESDLIMDRLDAIRAEWEAAQAGERPVAIHESPIHAWFELSYAQFLTLPRLVMEAMPPTWQTRMAVLLVQLDETFDWRPKEGRYWVRLKDSAGRYTDAPLSDYRHGSVEHLRRS